MQHIIKYFYALVFTTVPLALLAQPGWQLKDLSQDGVFGISAIKAYAYLQTKPSKQVIVAVIDSGIDTAHVDLKKVIWTNSNEIPGNGLDDDHNGYIDDVHGWNFIGDEKGREDVSYLGNSNKHFFDSLGYTAVPAVYRDGYQSFKRMSEEYYGHVQNLTSFIADLRENRETLNTITENIGKPQPVPDDFLKYKPHNEQERIVIGRVTKALPSYKDLDQYRKLEIDTLITRARYHLSHGLNGDLTNATPELPADGTPDITNDPAGLVTQINQTAFHGTHVAGIIAGTGKNGLGAMGIANNARIMVLKVNSVIRELRDVNLARAIRYAADNGARVINLSMGKYYTWKKNIVDEAIKYAMSKNVLIVQAAMNNGIDLDKTTLYPNRNYSDGHPAGAYLVVGASGLHNDSLLLASFSNYGAMTVDLFAPGVEIYSTIPGSTYEAWNGTSMAAPVVSGLAAMIMQYFPDLTATEVKDIIIASVNKVQGNVRIQDENGNNKFILFAKTCMSGGIVNAYNAVLLAEAHVADRARKY